MKPYLILFFLMAASIFFVPSVQAQGFSVTLALNTVNTPMGSVVTNTVTVTNLDAADHTINLGASAASFWSVTFTPTQVTVTAAILTATSTMTVLVPGQNDFCPSHTSTGPYFNTFTVTGTDTVSHLSSTASFVVNVPSIASPVTATVEASDQSYRLGEVVSLSMTSNYPAQYSLQITKPDGNLWTSASGTLPATFTKATVKPLGTYTAQLIAYFCGSSQTSTTFKVTPDTYDVAVTIAGLPSGVTTPLRVDGANVADMASGDTRTTSFPIGTTHSFQVAQLIAGSEGFRYYAASDSWTVSEQASNTFTYTTQVYLEVSSDPQGVTITTPSAWFTQGSSVNIADVPSQVQGDQGVKYVFSKWTVDGIGRSGNGFSFTMDAPHKVVAKYDTYFLLTVTSNYGAPQGQGFYKAGSNAVFSVTSPVSVNFGIQQVFVSWQGDYTGADPSGSITMDSPKQVTASWRTSSTGLYVAVAVVAVAAVAVTVTVLLLLRRKRQLLEPEAAIMEPPLPPQPSETAGVAIPVPRAKVCGNCKNVNSTDARWCTECGHPFPT